MNQKREITIYDNIIRDFKLINAWVSDGCLPIDTIDTLGNNRIVMNASGAVVQLTNYYPSGTTIAESPARSDQGIQPYKFGSKELDRSHGLDFYDFEARQFDPVIMRFTRPDPLQEKYYSISPYAYCNNNPINAIDPTGKDIIVLQAPTGAFGWGHSAVLVGNDRTGWTYVSKDGSKLLPWNGPSRHTNSEEDKVIINNEAEFNSSRYTQNGGKPYTQRIRFTTTEEQDKKAIDAAEASSKSWYSFLFNNCMDVVSDALVVVGLNPGYTWFGTDNPYADPTTDKSPIPNERLKKIARNNKADIYDVDLNIRSNNTNNNSNSGQNVWSTINNWLQQNPNIVVTIH